MPRPTPESVRMRPSIVWLALGLLLADVASAQTTAALGTSIVFPVAAQTVSFASEMTLFNPGADAGDGEGAVSTRRATPTRPVRRLCNDVAMPAGRSVQITLATQCALGVSGGHFGLVVVADKAVPATHAFYGYMRVQNPQGIGFSVEGFPEGLAITPLVWRRPSGEAKPMTQVRRMRRSAGGHSNLASGITRDGRRRRQQPGHGDRGNGERRRVQRGERLRLEHCRRER